jgi:predicted ArsR family transcriptional regulator
MDEFTAVASLADPTRRRVYDYVTAQDEPVGREQAAAGTGLPLHTARFHLERLVDEGLLATEFRRLSGKTGPGAGRPAKLYCRASGEVSVSVPPRNYDLVGSVLAAAVARSLAGTPLDEALSDEARRRGVEAGSSFPGGDPGPAPGLERARALMEREGFEPSVEDDELTLRNCPFDALAKEQPALVCGVNLDYVGGALEGLGCDGLRARLEPSPEHCCVRVGHDEQHEQPRGRRSRRTADRAG